LTNEEAEKPPGKWTDEQKLTLETFKEIVATDVENVWVVAYIDPRCRDCLVLSVEWEKLTQIEEKEKRKIKLGYVDISVEENWKIIQDHTKGKKMTHTPAVTLYGEDKTSPYWYDENKQPDAYGVHTWVSSYADAYGYGYWDPEDYAGAGVYSNYGGYHGYGSYGKYGIGNRAAYGYDSERHEGALKPAGVYTGPGGKGYMTSGKWQEGKQINQIQASDDGVVMRRRTVTEGGKLSGAAHDADEGYERSALAPKGYTHAKPQYGVGYGSYGGYGQKQSYGGYGQAGYGQKSYGGYG